MSDDVIERMLEEWKPISDMIDRYEQSLLDAYFPNRHKRGYVGWTDSRDPDSKNWHGFILVYDWTFETLFARYVGGP